MFVQDVVIWPQLVDNRPLTQVDVDGTLLDVEPNFCNLEDMLCAGGGCKLAIVTRCSWESLQHLCTYCPVTWT